VRTRELTAEQRRIAIDIVQLYEHVRDIEDEYRRFRGGLRWKSIGDRQYLVRIIDRRGHERSLGPRSAATEEIYREFTAKKGDLAERRHALSLELRRQAKFCIAAGINRVPRIAADIVRSLDLSGLLGDHLIILGSHALYAYEMAAGVQLKAGLLQTEDLDTLLNSRAEMELAGSIRSIGLLGILERVDKTFQPQRKRSFRAVNANGFMVDLLRAPIDPPGTIAMTSIGRATDLIAEPLGGLEWLVALPRLTQIVVASNGFPVRFVVPDARVFALHKLWLSLQPTRDPLKRKRDFRQGDAVGQLALEYLNLSFDDPAVKALPAALTMSIPGLLGRLRDRRNKSGDAEPALPPGFGSTDDDAD
jgi:hypothetical protein